jgi:aryl-alcohol dehydrogenase-like predicted oxidoreductase
MSTQEKISRRHFFRTLIGGSALASLADRLASSVGLAAEKTPARTMPSRLLGKTGYAVRLFSLGGQATLEKSGTRDAALAIIHRAIDLGVNYIDTAAAYGRGVSEQYIGEVMKTRRKEVYLATKTHDRTYDGSMRLLEQSLKNLQTDYLDCWQLHRVGTQSDLEQIFAPNGALRALEKARAENIVRFLGIAGHTDPFVLKTALEQYPFDTLLMAINAADRHRLSFIDNLLPTALKHNVGIIGMKIPARGRLFTEGGISRMEQALRYVLTFPVSTVIVGISTLKELEENVEIARNFTPYSEKELAQLEELTKPYYAEASWFKAP